MLSTYPLTFMQRTICFVEDDYTMPAWQCLQCGNVEDAVILANRRKQAVIDEVAA